MLFFNEDLTWYEAIEDAKELHAAGADSMIELRYNTTFEAMLEFEKEVDLDSKFYTLDVEYAEEEDLPDFIKETASKSAPEKEEEE